MHHCSFLFILCQITTRSYQQKGPLTILSPYQSKILFQNSKDRFFVFLGQIQSSNIPNKHNKQHYRIMDSHPPSDHECRQISSSSERCKCALCKNQLDMQLNNKKPLANIYLYRHLKKRQGPPTKKEANKDATMKQKTTYRPQQQGKLPATPVKHKPDRSKEALPNVGTPEYHMVSQSQRTKVGKEDLMFPQQRRQERVKPKVRVVQEEARQAEISQHPQPIKILSRNTPSAERGRVDASPNCILPLPADKSVQM